MQQLRNILLLAFKDYGYEWRMSGCFILGLAAVLAPLIIIFGLKFGVVTNMVNALIENPRNLEIRPLGSGHFDANFFKRLANHREVAFIIPRTRTLSATIELKSDKSAVILPTELIPSGAGDPLLKRVSKKPQGYNQVVLSDTAARKLNVKEGAVVEGNIFRQYRGKRERAMMKFLVVGVVPASVFSRNAIFTTLDLVLAAESFRDGRAVPALKWDGDAPMEENRAYPSYRLYAKSILGVSRLNDDLTAQGYRIKTNAAEIETVKSIDRNLAIVFWVIALAGMIGFSLSLGASLWANVDRKRRELSVLRLVGLNSQDIVMFPVFQSLFTAVSGWVVAVFIYLIVEQIINRLFISQVEAGQLLCYLLPQHLLGALALTLITAITAAVLGGYRAARIEPATGLREL